MGDQSFMPDDPPKRHRKRRGNKKLYKIEWRICWGETWRPWSFWRAYETEARRDQAFKVLERKKWSDGIEYRIAEDGKV